MEEHGAHVVTGVIVRRRCCGKHLSFANVRCNRGIPTDDNNNNNEDEQVEGDMMDDASTNQTDSDKKVVFRRAHFHGDNFPIKSSDLPYGARVSMTVLPTLHKDSLWQVTSWRMLDEEDPKAHALRMAKTGDDGVMCSTYLQVRADAYFNLNQKQQDRVRTRPPRWGDDEGSTLSPHGNPRAKGLRAKIFCQWLLEHVLVVDADQEEKVLDVAGGKGQLSIELSAFGIACTVMDPLIRKSNSRVDKEQNPNYLHSSFSQNEESMSLLQDYTCLVGLHPDECTEDILDMALRANKKVAIIPCCVFPSLFPLRTLRGGRTVQSYDDFLRYLLDKDDRLQKATLPFDGKNEVIFMS